MSACDRRIEKTKQAILEALEVLMEEKHYAQITVQEIIDKANVGRTTFYTHFPTKDILLEYCIKTNIEALDQGVFHTNEGLASETVFPIANLFDHIKAHKRLFKGLIQSDVDELLFSSCKDFWKGQFVEHLKKQGIESTSLSVPIDVVMNYLMGSLIELIKGWMNTGMKEEPQMMEEYWLTMTMPALHSIIIDSLQK